MSSPTVTSSVHFQARKTHTQKNKKVQGSVGKDSVNDDDSITEIYTTWHYGVIRLSCTTDLKD